MSWNEVSGQEMLFLVLPSNNSTFYVNEYVDVECHGIQYYFSLGYRIGIEKNGLWTLVPEGYT